jgi:hypothetical protein
LEIQKLEQQHENQIAQEREESDRILEQDRKAHAEVI